MKSDCIGMLLTVPIIISEKRPNRYYFYTHRQALPHTIDRMKTILEFLIEKWYL